MSAGVGGVSRASLTPTWSTSGFQEAGAEWGWPPGSSKRVRGAEPFARQTNLMGRRWEFSFIAAKKGRITGWSWEKHIWKVFVPSEPVLMA